MSGPTERGPVVADGAKVAGIALPGRFQRVLDYEQIVEISVKSASVQGFEYF